MILDIEVQGTPSRSAQQAAGYRADLHRAALLGGAGAPPHRPGHRHARRRSRSGLLRAKVEFQTAHTYDYFVINDTVENAVRELDAIITAEHCKPAERMEIIRGK